MDLDNVIKEAVKKAKQVNYVFRLGAVVFNQSRIISAGYNRVANNKAACAEKLAILKAPSDLLTGSSILIVRVRKLGTYGMAKPCDKCQKFIEKSGISKIIYSTPDGWITTTI